MVEKDIDLTQYEYKHQHFLEQAGMRHGLPQNSTLQYNRTPKSMAEAQQMEVKQKQLAKLSPAKKQSLLLEKA